MTGYEPVEELTGAEVDRVEDDTGLLALQRGGRVRLRLWIRPERSGRTVFAVDHVSGNGSRGCSP